MNYKRVRGERGEGNAAAYFLSLEDEIYVGLLSARMRLKELMQC